MFNEPYLAAMYYPVPNVELGTKPKSEPTAPSDKPSEEAVASDKDKDEERRLTVLELNAAARERIRAVRFS